MNKLMLVPDNSSYKVEFNDGNIAVRLNGGRSRIRKQSIDNSNTVDVYFVLTTDEYRYLMAFYRSVINRGALPFLMDIITETSELVTHKVTMLPNSFKLNSQKGQTYYVSFTVEAEPLEENAEKDKQIIQNHESGRKPFTPPQEGWGNFFTPSELSPNATNVQDGIYRMDGDTVLSLRNAKGQIFQTKYTVNGIWTRYLHGGNWSSWLQLGSERVISTTTELYDSTGRLVRTFQGEGISGKIPDGDYTLRILDIHADGTTRVRSSEKTRIELGADQLQVIPKQYGMTVTWNLREAKSGGHTEVWLGDSNDVASAKLIAAVQWPAMEHEYSNATTARKYFFWIRHIDRRGVEGKMIGPVEGIPATPFEQEFQNIRGDIVVSKNEAISHANKEIEKLNTAIDKKIKNVNIDTTEIDKAIKAAADKAEEARTKSLQATQSVVRETEQRKEAIEAEIRARNLAIGRAKGEVETSLNQYKEERKTKDSVITENYKALTSRVGTAETKMTQLEQQKASKTEVASIAETALKSKWESAASQAKTDALNDAAADATQKANAAQQAAQQAAEGLAQAKANAARQAAIAAASDDAAEKAKAAKLQAIAVAAEKVKQAKEAAAEKAKELADKALADAKTYADRLKDGTDAKIANLESTRVTRKQAEAMIQQSLTAKFQVPDTRNDNQPPSWYWENYPRQTVREFKEANALGLGSGYAALDTAVPWKDPTGGMIFQTAYLPDGKVMRRNSDAVASYGNGRYNYTKDTWTAWVQDETVDGAQAKANAVKAIADAADALSRANKADITVIKRDYATKTEVGTLSEERARSVFNDFSFSGRNLLLKSNPNKEFGYGATFEITEAPKVGESVVVTLWGNPGSDRSGKIGVFNTYGYGQLGVLTKIRDGVYRGTFIWKHHTYSGDPTRQDKTLNVYFYPSTGTSQSSLKAIKMEFGNVGSEWTPAPEETEAALKRAEADITETKQTLTRVDTTVSRVERETSTTLNGMTTKVNELTTSVDGMSAKKAVTIDNGGYLTGFELLSDRTNGVPKGSIKFNVDSFIVGKNGTNIKPFIVSGTTVAINGELVVNGQAIIAKLNAGVIDGSKVKAGTITANHLTSGSVTADKIAAGAIVATKIAANAITADKLAANVINGNHIAAGISIRAPRIVGGSLNIADKFVVSETGEVQIRAFAGNVNKGMIIKNNTIFVYDEAGVLRMKIGYLG